MNDKKTNGLLDLCDDRFVQEAMADKKGKRIPFIVKSISAVAAALVVVLGGVWLLKPFNTTPPSVEQHKSSPYFAIIQKLNTALFKKPEYSNNFDMFFSNGILTTGKGEATLNGAMAPESTTGTDQQYHETTDNQVNGVTEGDIIKRSDKYIYYLSREGILSVYSIDGKNSQKITSFTVDAGENYIMMSNSEMYLSKDCKTLSVIAGCYDRQNGKAEVRVIGIDVSDSKNVKELKRTSISGEYVSSRISGDKLIVVTSFLVQGEPDFSKEEEFIPQINTGNGFVSIGEECIVYPDELSSTSYTVLSEFDVNDLKFNESLAFLSYSQNIYASLDNIYVTRSYNDKTEKDGIETFIGKTDIYAVKYSGSGLSLKGSVTLSGTVKDQYSLDEYNGVLRVVTTNSKSTRKKSETRIEIFEVANDYTNASLYCVDVGTMKQIAAVERFAPKGESVRSVRFDKTAAYVCTSIQLSDPVFFFDLSDVNNITYKDTGTIEGFSTSLIDLKDGYLLGIGVGSDFNTLKIEVYRETENGVESVDSYEYKNCWYSRIYKAYYVDREKGLIGLGVCDDTSKYDSKYLLLHFGNNGLVKLREVLMNDTDLDRYRAFTDDQYLYVAAEGKFKVVSIG